MADENKNVVFAWQAPEFEYHTKTPDWYWAIGLIVVSIAIASFVRGNFFFAVFVVIAGVLLFIYGTKKPRIVQFKITDNGITAENFHYPWRNIQKFWITEDEKLLLQLNRAVMPDIVIPLGDTPATAVRDILRREVKEEEMTEPASHKVMDFFKF